VVHVLRFLLVAVATVVCGAAACVASPFDREGRALVWIARRWVAWIVASCGVEVSADGLEHVPRDRPCVYMSNHQSVFDVVAIVATLPVHWRFVAKRELLWIPFFGWALALSGQVIVDRRNRAASVASLGRAARRVREGASVIIFPEGTRSPDGALREFRSGGFHLAIEAGVPIVPVTVSGSRAIAAPGSLRIASGRVRVRYGAPIPTEGLRVEDRTLLKRRVAEAIERGFDPALQAAAGAQGTKPVPAR
jgi:1-acyl-sn-glycerol-3-phosphate acyltransferase